MFFHVVNVSHHIKQFKLKLVQTNWETIYLTVLFKRKQNQMKCGLSEIMDAEKLKKISLKSV